MSHSNNKFAQSAKIKNCQFGGKCRVFEFADLSCSECGVGVIIGDDTSVVDSHIAESVSINRRNYIYRSTIGRYSYTGINTSIRSAKVGGFCSMAWNISIGGGNHDLDHVTTSPLWRFNMLESGNLSHKDNPELQKRLNLMPSCTIGNDVWIAANVVILRGVTVGDGAVIGAGAVVTKDVEPYSIVAGVPARKIKMRFDEQTATVLQEIAWWSWPTDLIRQHLDLIYSTKVDSSVIARLREITAPISPNSQECSE
jgi:virginiamycin A acetyltransferase